MDPKPRPNDGKYLEVLRRLGPEGRLRKALELTETARQLVLAGIRAGHPELPESSIRRLYLSRLAECHKQTS
jgi:hypothetical protein